MNKRIHKEGKIIYPLNNKENLYNLQVLVQEKLTQAGIGTSIKRSEFVFKDKFTLILENWFSLETIANSLVIQILRLDIKDCILNDLTYVQDYHEIFWAGTYREITAEIHYNIK